MPLSPDPLSLVPTSAPVGAGSPVLEPLEPFARRRGAAHEGSVSLLVDADGEVLVVLHGDIDTHLQGEIRELVDDLVTNRALTSGQPVRVLAENVTVLELPGVWLLLELRRAAKPAAVTIVAPSAAVREALDRHGIQGLRVEP